MNEFFCEKTYKVEYAHQLYSSYTDLCHETIHGHSGKIVIKFAADELNNDGMVVDFGMISDIVKSHIMEKYDHALFMPKMFSKGYLNCLRRHNKRLTITDQNPTAENFAKWIYWECTNILKEQRGLYNIHIVQVDFWETDTGKATYKFEEI